ELRQHNRTAIAAWCGGLLQHLLCDELAGGSDLDARIGDGAGDPVLGLDDRHRIRLAGAIGASRDGEHGGLPAYRPRLHVGGEPRLYPGTARCCAETAPRPRPRSREKITRRGQDRVWLAEARDVDRLLGDELEQRWGAFPGLLDAAANCRDN